MKMLRNGFVVVVCVLVLIVSFVFAGDVVVQEGDVDAAGIGDFNEIDTGKVALDNDSLVLESVGNFYKISRSDSNVASLNIDMPLKIYNTLNHASAYFQFIVNSVQGDSNIEAVSGRHLTLLNCGTGNLYLNVSSGKLVMSLDDMVASTKLRVGDTTAPTNTFEVKGDTTLGDGGTTNYVDVNSVGHMTFNGSAGLIIPNGTTPAPAVEGSLFLDTDTPDANGSLVIYSNGAWHTVASWN